MKILAWNIRGIGGSGKATTIRRFVAEKKPFSLGLIELNIQRFMITKLSVGGVGRILGEQKLRLLMVEGD